MSTIRKAWQKIFWRRQAYRMVFLNNDGNPHPNASRVLADLKRFCKAQTSTVYVSPVSQRIDPIAIALAVLISANTVMPGERPYVSLGPVRYREHANGKRR